MQSKWLTPVRWSPSCRSSKTVVLSLMLNQLPTTRNRYTSLKETTTNRNIWHWRSSSNFLQPLLITIMTTIDTLCHWSKFDATNNKKFGANEHRTSRFNLLDVKQPTMVIEYSAFEEARFFYLRLYPRIES